MISIRHIICKAHQIEKQLSKIANTAGPFDTLPGRFNALVSRRLGFDERLRYVHDEDAIHHESEWARRLPDAIRFLLQ